MKLKPKLRHPKRDDVHSVAVELQHLRHAKRRAVLHFTVASSASSTIISNHRVSSVTMREEVFEVRNITSLQVSCSQVPIEYASLCHWDKTIIDNIVEPFKDLQILIKSQSLKANHLIGVTNFIHSYINEDKLLQKRFWRMHLFKLCPTYIKALEVLAESMKKSRTSERESRSKKDVRIASML